MARIHEIIRQIERDSSELAKELAEEVTALSERRAFGLSFERHTPEEVELPQRTARRGDKVHLLPRRGEAPTAGSRPLWTVVKINQEASEAEIERRVFAEGASESQVVALEDLVVVAEFRDPIFPGLVSTGRLERGADRPFHTVINGENFHALQALLFTHRGKVDVIYIDPPYNTGAKDWKYNNDYVASEDLYRHSKWLAFMERRLVLARELLKPDDSTLIVTVDENEVARLLLLIEQTMPDRELTAVSIVHNPRGVQGNNFSYTHEYAIFAIPRDKRLISPRRLTASEKSEEHLRNWGDESERAYAANCFYPIVVRDGAVVGFGEAVDRDDSVHPSHNEIQGDGSIFVWPVDSAGVERKWRYARGSVEAIRPLLRVRRNDRGALRGEYEIMIEKDTGSYKTVWADSRFAAGEHGTSLVKKLTGRKFPYPKSLYAVEECLRAAVGNRPDAVVVDFFAGSGTTAHAVFRLNRQDDGRRVSISVTNNEVSASEQRALRERGLRPGDDDWERWGICEYITKPRISAAITGLTPDGSPVVGNYAFIDESPIADGFSENAEFFTLSYESPLHVLTHGDFPMIAPLLWLRAGAIGRRIGAIDAGWDVAETYGVLADLDKSAVFIDAIRAVPTVRIAYVITDEDRLFEAVVKALPASVEPVRMYDAYVRNFEDEARVMT